MLTFADAVEKFGKRLNEKNLGPTYSRSGQAFRGQQLQMMFVVLSDLQGPPWRARWGRRDHWKTSLPLFQRMEEPEVLEKSQGGGGDGRGSGRGRGSSVEREMV